MYIAAGIVPRSSGCHRDRDACCACRGRRHRHRDDPRTQRKQSWKIVLASTGLPDQTLPEHCEDLQSARGGSRGRDVAADEPAIAVFVNLSALSESKARAEIGLVVINGVVPSCRCKALVGTVDRRLARCKATRDGNVTLVGLADRSIEGRTRRGGREAWHDGGWTRHDEEG